MHSIPCTILCKDDVQISRIQQELSKCTDIDHVINLIKENHLYVPVDCKNNSDAKNKTDYSSALLVNLKKESDRFMRASSMAICELNARLAYAKIIQLEVDDFKKQLEKLKQQEINLEKEISNDVNSLQSNICKQFNDQSMKWMNMKIPVRSKEVCKH
ncbi:hypothetical protein GJ496_011945 [Pomphorhynchus laevis]|nr:hypothetical protein GJ496_011945 [Pomphorhynchus laevis]